MSHFAGGTGRHLVLEARLKEYDERVETLAGALEAVRKCYDQVDLHLLEEGRYRLHLRRLHSVFLQSPQDLCVRVPDHTAKQHLV